MKFRKFFPASEAPWSESRLVRMWGKILIAGLVCKVLSALIPSESWRLAVFYGGTAVLAVGMLLALVGAISFLRLVIAASALHSVICMGLGAGIWYFALSWPSLWFTVPGALLLCLGMLETWNHAVDGESPLLEPF